MTTVKEDYALARSAATEYDKSRGDALYLNRLNMHRFRDEGTPPQDLQRLIKTETESVRITANALEELLRDIGQGLFN